MGDARSRRGRRSSSRPGSSPAPARRPATGSRRPGRRRAPAPAEDASAVGREVAWPAGRPRAGRRRGRRPRRGSRRGRTGRRPVRRAAANPKSDDGSPCSTAPAVRRLRSCRAGSSRTTWNQPSASDSRVSPPSGSQRGAHSQASPAGIRRSSPPTMSTTETSDLQARSSRWAAKAIRPPSGDQSNSSTSSPAGVIATGSAGRGWLAGRPRRGTGASIRQSCDQPRRRETKASWRPSGDQRRSR